MISPVITKDRGTQFIVGKKEKTRLYDTENTMKNDNE